MHLSTGKSFLNAFIWVIKPLKIKWFLYEQFKNVGSFAMCLCWGLNIDFFHLEADF